MTQIRSLKKLLSDTQTSPFEFALIFKVRSMIVERRVMIPWKPIDMSFSNPFGDQVLHLFSHSLNNSERYIPLRQQYRLASGFLTSKQFEISKFQLRKSISQFVFFFFPWFTLAALSFAFLLKFACHLQDIFWLHSGFLELVPCRVKHNMDVFIRVCSKEKSYQSFSS